MKISWASLSKNNVFFTSITFMDAQKRFLVSAVEQQACH